MCVLLNASVSTATDYSDLARSKRVTCVEPLSVPHAEYHNLYHHQCYIQNPTKLEQKRKLLKSRKRKADGSQNNQTKENLFVYWDSETMQDTGIHVPNLVCAATSNCDDLFHFEGTTCIQDFIDWLRELALDFKLTVLAHNSQGFDSYLNLD